MVTPWATLRLNWSLRDRVGLDLFFVGQDRGDRLTGLLERTAVRVAFEDVFVDRTTGEFVRFLLTFRRGEFFGRGQGHRTRFHCVQDRALHDDGQTATAEFGDVA